MLYTVNTVEFAQSSTEQTPEIWHQRLGRLNIFHENNMHATILINGACRQDAVNLCIVYEFGLEIVFSREL